MSDRLNIAVIGAGTMGANHARVVTRHSATELAAIVDPHEARGRALAHAHGVNWLPDATQMDDGLDGAIIAAPTELHLDLALPLIESGVPVLLEKPLAPDVEQAKMLVDAAHRSGAPLMCGFVERFNPAVVTAMDLIDGPIVHIVAVRHSPATPRIRTNVVYDLLIHDIDLALRVVQGSPVTSAFSNTWTAASGVVDVADCTLGFAGGGVATMSASRASQRKVRNLSICSEGSLVEVDLLRHDVTVYRHRFHEQVDQGGPTYRAETLVDIPFVRHDGEPLALQLEHFVSLMTGRASAAAELETLLAPHEIAADVAAGA